MLRETRKGYSVSWVTLMDMLLGFYWTLGHHVTFWMRILSLAVTFPCTTLLLPQLNLLMDANNLPTHTVNIKDLHLGNYHTTGISAQVIKIQRYDAILGKPWLYHANPSIDWRSNKLTFQYGHKTIIVKADSTKPQPLGCNSVFISHQQLARSSSSAELFALFLANTETATPSLPQGCTTTLATIL